MKPFVLLAEIEWNDDHPSMAHNAQEVVPWVQCEYCMCHHCFKRSGTRILSMHIDFVHQWVHGAELVQLELADEQA